MLLERCEIAGPSCMFCDQVAVEAMISGFPGLAARLLLFPPRNPRRILESDACGDADTGRSPSKAKILLLVLLPSRVIHQNQQVRDSQEGADPGKSVGRHPTPVG